MTAYLISMATYVGFFMILALALNLQWGMTGMVNFGIAGFYALGAYTSGLLTTKAGWPVGLAMPMAAAAGMAAGRWWHCCRSGCARISWPLSRSDSAR